MYSLRTAEALAAVLLLDSGGLDDIMTEELDELQEEVKNIKVKQEAKVLPLKRNLNYNDKLCRIKKKKREVISSEYKGVSFLENEASSVGVQINHFKKDFAFSASLVEKVTKMIAPLYKAKHTMKTLDDFVLISLAVLTSTASYNEISHQFSKSKTIISNYSQEFNELMSDNFSSLIRWPKGNEFEIANSFEQICGFPDTLGVFGACHIPFNCHLRGNLNGIALILSATSDPFLKFTSLSIDTPSNFQATNGMSSQTIQTLIKEPEDLVPGKMHILAGLGFPLCNQILTPYPGTELSIEQKIYNEKLDETRRVVFKAFGHLRKQFPKLLKTDSKDFNKAAASVVTACILHNLIIEDDSEGINFIDSEETEEDFLESDPFDELELCTKRDELAKQLCLKETRN